MAVGLFAVEKLVGIVLFRNCPINNYEVTIVGSVPGVVITWLPVQIGSENVTVPGMESSGSTL